MHGIYVRLVMMLMALFLVTACDDERSDKGVLAVGLTDAASGGFQSVYVTIGEVQVHRGGDEDGHWLVVASPGRTYNLLELVNGLIEQLGVSPLATGSYTQMRLIIGDEADDGTNILGQSHPYANYLIDSQGECRRLRVPSGDRTGIKLVHGFEIVKDLTTDLVLDFDVDRSVVRAGNSGKWMLKPTIKVIDTVENATVSGVVADQTDAALPGARVSAQVFDQNMDQVRVVASTLSDGTGEYLMYLEPGPYTITVYADGYGPACVDLLTETGRDDEASFVLSPADMQKITCHVVLPQGVQEGIVKVSFILTSPCDETRLIELKSLNVSQTGTYEVSLPAGTYRVLATDGATMLPVRNITTGSPVTLDFTAK